MIFYAPRCSHSTHTIDERAETPARDHHEGGAVSLRSPKLTNLRKSENTSRFPARACPSARGGVSAPDGVPLSGGELSAARIPSAGPGPASSPGRETRLPPGEVDVCNCSTVPLAGGSMSSEERKDVCSSSGFVLVLVTKESRRSFCSLRDVPLRSRICDDVRVRNCGYLGVRRGDREASDLKTRSEQTYGLGIEI